MRIHYFAFLGATLGMFGCGDTTGGADASVDASVDLSASCTGATCSSIKHLVVIVQENHTFDNYFGQYCTAATGSNPTCTTGPACCEAGPTKDPGTMMAPIVLDDAANGGRDPNHTQACELSEINGGKMDSFISSAACGNKGNFAYADPAAVLPYTNFAKSFAMGDRYFQSYAGQSSANDMYFARAKFVFPDNQYQPNSIGLSCSFNSTTKDFTETTIGDLLKTANVSWTFYAGGYKAMVDRIASSDGGACPTLPADCAIMLNGWPCLYDSSDVPFQYYPSLRDNPSNFRDSDQFAGDLTAGQLPAVSFVKPIGYKTEHPGFGLTISSGTTFVTGVVTAIQNSQYAADTLILLTYDEGGGFFDHVSPPPTSAVDSQPYGTRVPFLAIGPFARTNFVSHVTMEHSSVVKFIEWNFLGGKTGQLGTRDVTVNNIGSLLDPAKTGTAVPE